MGFWNSNMVHFLRMQQNCLYLLSWNHLYISIYCACIFFMGHLTLFLDSNDKKYYNSCPSYPNSFLRPDFTIRKSTSFVSVSSLCNLFIFLSRALCGCETFSNVTGRLVWGWVQAKITTLLKFKIKLKSNQPERKIVIVPSHVPSRILAGCTESSRAMARFLACPVVLLSRDNEGTSVLLSWKVPSRWKE